VFYAATSNIALLFFAMRTDLMDVGLTIARKGVDSRAVPTPHHKHQNTHIQTQQHLMFLCPSIELRTYPTLAPSNPSFPRSPFPDTTKFRIIPAVVQQQQKNNNSSSHHHTRVTSKKLDADFLTSNVGPTTWDKNKNPKTPFRCLQGPCCQPTMPPESSGET